MSALISATELKSILQQPHVRVLDASHNLPPSSMGIPGAQDFNIDSVADPCASRAHTVPTPEIFSQKVGALGIGNDDLVIVYDRGGVAMAAARVWWMFRLFGHDNVKILDGGLPAWVKSGYAPGEKSAVIPAPAIFKANFRPELLKNLDQMTDNMTRKSFSVLDARTSQRYEGGHIPGAINAPFINLVNDDGTLKPRNQLEKALPAHLQKDIACLCGSGVTACVVALALYEVGSRNAAVYDGSWTEWGSRQELPQAMGA